MDFDNIRDTIVGLATVVVYYIALYYLAVYFHGHFLIIILIFGLFVPCFMLALSNNHSVFNSVVAGLFLTALFSFFALLIH